MAILTILLEGDPTLLKKSLPVKRFDDRFESGKSRAVLIDGHDMEPREQPPGERIGEQGFPCLIVDRAFAGDACQRVKGRSVPSRSPETRRRTVRKVHRRSALTHPPGGSKSRRIEYSRPQNNRLCRPPCQ